MIAPAPTWRVIHGDCLDVLTTLAPGSVDAVVTDPPYGIGGDVVRCAGRIVESLPEWDVTDHGWVRGAARTLREGGHLVAFCDHKETGALWAECESAGLKARNALLWVKHATPPNPRRCFQSAWEVAVWSTKGSDYSWSGGGLTPNVYFGNIVKCDRLHPTQKDEGLMRWLLRTLGIAGGLVLDPFTGSGTTGIAALAEGCAFLGIEKEAKYVKIAEARIKAAAAQGRFAFGEPAP